MGANDFTVQNLKQTRHADQDSGDKMSNTFNTVTTINTVNNINTNLQRLSDIKAGDNSVEPEQQKMIENLKQMFLNYKPNVYDNLSN